MNPHFLAALNNAASAPGGLTADSLLYLVKLGGEYNISITQILALGGIVTGGASALTGSLAQPVTLFTAVATIAAVPDDTLTADIDESVPEIPGYLADTLAAAHHLVLVNAAAADFTVNLPAAAGAPGREYVIKKIGAAGTVTVAGHGSDSFHTTAAAASPLTITANGGTLRLTAFGNVWYSS